MSIAASRTPELVPAASNARRPLTITRERLFGLAAFLSAHVVLAIMMKTLPGIATAHALACGLGGIVFAATTRNIRNLAPVIAYIAGCEVLWRMNHADVFWEFAKYGIAAILFIGLLRIRSPRNRPLVLLYLGLLLPSVALSFLAFDLDTARKEVSFTLAGPLALTMAVMFFSNIRITQNQLLGTFAALLAPVIGIATLSLRSTLEYQDQLEFANGANLVTSGGYGPNQVAAMLGLGMMFLLLVVIDRRLPRSLRLPLFALAAVLGAQSTLTFARGGLFLGLAGVAGAIFILLKGNRRGRATVIVVTALTIVVGKYIIEPQLDSITKGELVHRYSSTKSSGRDLFIASELELFSEDPILGVGPGVGMRIRHERHMFEGPSHTEYSRMLAEHGVFGLLSLCCLIGLGIRAVRQAREPTTRALALAMVIWVALFLAVYGMRLAAPGFVFGLAFAARIPSRSDPVPSPASVAA